MISIFTVPKPFVGKIAAIQRNALHSWTLLEPRCEIILIGDDAGTAEAAKEFGGRHIPKVKRNEFGTPLLSSIIGLAGGAAKNRIIAYVNTDIILLNDFLPAVKRAKSIGAFMLVGRRWDLDIEYQIDFSHPAWEKNLRRTVKNRGVLNIPDAMDFFVARHGFWRRKIPPFALGRYAWDNYLVYKAKSLGLTIVDATPVTTVIHQNHDYSHSKEWGHDLKKGPEAKRNAELAGFCHCTVNDAIWELTEKGIQSTYNKRRYQRLSKRNESKSLLEPLRRIVLMPLGRRWPRLYFKLYPRFRRMISYLITKQNR
jgi:hypothetical protein